jgi:membrane-associated phospholipid phosphatase
VPIAEMYGADLLGVKAKNHWFDQTKYLFISDMLSTGITSLIKIALNKTRPNGGDLSFPSGHSCFSFTNATVLYNEYKESAPMLAYSGFAFSTATASLRMVHNKHWLSDVLVGSGIGILVANFVYVVEPFKNFNPFKNNENISLLPQIVENSYGLYFSYKF